MRLREVNALRKPVDACRADQFVKDAAATELGSRDTAQRNLGVLADQVQECATARAGAALNQGALVGGHKVRIVTAPNICVDSMAGLAGLSRLATFRKAA